MKWRLHKKRNIRKKETMRIKIYQLNPERDTRRVQFESFEQTEQCGGVRASEYKCVFHGDVEARHLDDIYNHFNGRTKPYTGTFQGHSFSVSDVVEVLGDIPEMYGRIDYLDTIGEVGEEYWIATKEKFGILRLPRLRHTVHTAPLGGTAYQTDRTGLSLLRFGRLGEVRKF